jgi:hypothetical protein
VWTSADIAAAEAALAADAADVESGAGPDVVDRAA